MEPVADTWVISFEDIRTQNARAANILSLMSFLDRQGIPDSLLRSKDKNQVDFEDTIGILEAFSFLSPRTNGGTATTCTA